MVSQTNPNVGVYVQDEWKVALEPDAQRRAALRPAVPRDDRDRPQQRLAARWASRGRRSASRRTVVRGSAGLFYDRVPLRALANALLSAGNTTDVAQPAPDQHQPVAGAGRRAGVSRTSSRRRVPSVTLPNLTTMDPDMQNAYSRQASVEVEQQIGERGTVSVGYQYTARPQPDHLDQPERAVVRGGRHQQRLPPEPGLRATTASTRRRRDSNYHGLHLSFVQRPARWGHYRVVVHAARRRWTNVGEFFFSSPIDPFDLVEGLGPIRRRPAPSARR